MLIRKKRIFVANLHRDCIVLYLSNPVCYNEKKGEIMQEQSFIIVNGARLEVARTEYSLSLLEWLRSKANMLSIHSGCDAKQKCGICIVELDGQAIQACSVKMHTALTKHVMTVEGIPEPIRTVLANILLHNTNVPCGYCTAGLLIKIHNILKEKKELSPSKIIERLGFNGCTCIGAKELVQVVLDAQDYLTTQEEGPHIEYGGISSNSVRFGERRVVFGERPFVDDICMQSIELYGAIVWSDTQLFRVNSIDVDASQKIKGLYTVITGKSLSRTTVQAPDGQEWRIFLNEGDVGYCMSEVFGVILATTREEAEKARSIVQSSLTRYEPKTSVTEIIRESLDVAQAPILHRTLHYGKAIESLLNEGVCTVNEVFYSQPAPYVPLETPTAVAMYVEGHIHIYTQVADIMWLRRTLAYLLAVDEEYIHCMRMETNVLYNAREDYLVALYAGISAHLTQHTVHLSMTHDEVEKYRSQPIESIHDYTLLLDNDGKLLGAKIGIVIDGGAYTTDMIRVCDTLIKHATSGFAIPNVDLSCMLVSTNTIPRYMPRGKCLEASCIVMNRLLDKLSKLTRFNRYEIREKNILQAGDYTITGEYLYGDIVSKELLRRARELYLAQPSVSLSLSFVDTGLTNSNAMCMVAIDVIHGGDIVVYHPYPDYGNGMTTLIAQTILEVMNKENYNGITIRSTTDCMEAMQTIPDSDAVMMYLAHHATHEAAVKLREDILKIEHHSKMWGKRYVGFSSISSEGVFSIEKERRLQGSYTAILHVARCEEPYVFQHLTVFVDAGRCYNPSFMHSLMNGGITLSFNTMLGSRAVSLPPIQIHIEFVHGNASVHGYTFKGIYDASVIGIPSSYYSYMWTNYKRNLTHYPLS